MASLAHWIWLSSAAVSPKAKAALIQHFGDAEKAFFSPKGTFFTVPGVTALEAERLEQRDLSLVNPILGACEEQGLRILTYQDAAYPARLRNIFAPPVVLYAKGKLPELDREAAVAVIGTRKASVYRPSRVSVDVDATGFEPAASASRTPRSTKLSHASILLGWAVFQSLGHNNRFNEKCQPLFRD